MQFADIAYQIAVTAVPFVASALMIVIGAVFYQITGFLPGIMRAWADRQFREREAVFRANIERGLDNGVKSAFGRHLPEQDALREAIDHAIRSTPESVQFFRDTSGLTDQTLMTMARAAAVDRGLIDAGP